MDKKKHFVTVVSPSGESVTVDIYLTSEQYNLINQISTIITAEADITEPIMVVSKAVQTDETLEDGIVEE